MIKGLLFTFQDENPVSHVIQSELFQSGLCLPTCSLLLWEAWRTETASPSASSGRAAHLFCCAERCEDQHHIHPELPVVNPLYSSLQTIQWRTSVDIIMLFWKCQIIIFFWVVFYVLKTSPQLIQSFRGIMMQCRFAVNLQKRFVVYGTSPDIPPEQLWLILLFGWTFYFNRHAYLFHELLQ